MVPVRVIWELPGRLRLEMQKGTTVKIDSFDGTNLRGLSGTLTTQDQGLLESLLLNCAEHFFLTQVQGNATRFLGKRFQMEDISLDQYSGPFYDVYEVEDRIDLRVGRGNQQKYFYVNSDNHLLEKIRYTLKKGNMETVVEVDLESWQPIEGQMFPFSIVRKENEQPVVSLAIEAVDLGPAKNDGIFDNP
jgi:hypothetical protein